MAHCWYWLLGYSRLLSNKVKWQYYTLPAYWKGWTTESRLWTHKRYSVPNLSTLWKLVVLWSDLAVLNSAMALRVDRSHCRFQLSNRNDVLHILIHESLLPEPLGLFDKNVALWLTLLLQYSFTSTDFIEVSGTNRLSSGTILTTKWFFPSCLL